MQEKLRFLICVKSCTCDEVCQVGATQRVRQTDGWWNNGDDVVENVYNVTLSCGWSMN